MVFRTCSFPAQSLSSFQNHSSLSLPVGWSWSRRHACLRCEHLLIFPLTDSCFSKVLIWCLPATGTVGWEGASLSLRYVLWFCYTISWKCNISSALVQWQRTLGALRMVLKNFVPSCHFPQLQVHNDHLQWVVETLSFLWTLKVVGGVHGRNRKCEGPTLAG